MAAVYEWIRNLAGFFLFMAVIDNLLPGKKYRKYVQLFSGMILILLVLQPLTGSLRLEDAIAHAYESLVFQYQAGDLTEDILGIEEQRLEQVIGQYEEAVAMDVRQMAEEEGLFVKNCRVTIDRAEESETFGMVTHMKLEISEEERASGETVIPVEPIDPVQIEVQPEEAAASKESIATEKSQTEHSQVSSRDVWQEALVHLRRRIGSYYHLEEQYVEIQIAEGQG